ncbi:MAG: amidohydrolase family protein, partial [Coprobacillaceae bacterium]
MRTNKTKLSADYVVGFMNDQHVIYNPGVVVYQGSDVLYVGNKYMDEVDESYDYGSSIISPGFIDLDADIDSDHALQDIVFVKEEDKRFKIDLDADFRNSYTKEDYRNRHYFSMIHLLKNGITTAMPISGESFYEWGMSKEECELMAETAKEIGMRLYLGPSYKSKRTPQSKINSKLEKQSVKDAYDFAKKWMHKDTLIYPIMNPCQIHITNLEILKETAYFAQKSKIPYRIHACEAIREWEYTLPRFNLTTIDLFEKEKMLYNQFIIPHGITVKDSELDILSLREVSIVSTPLADANFATALFSFDKYLHYNINMTMGTDTQPGDMIRNMRMAWDLDRLCNRRKFFSRYTDEGQMIPLLPDEPLYQKTNANAFFDAATINGAKALGRDDLGKLCRGSKADIIIINLNDIHVGPIHDPIRTLINSCTGKNISDVIIDGKVIIKNYQYIKREEKEILK